MTKKNYDKLNGISYDLMLPVYTSIVFNNSLLTRLVITKDFSTDHFIDGFVKSGMWMGIQGLLRNFLEIMDFYSSNVKVIMSLLTSNNLSSVRDESL